MCVIGCKLLFAQFFVLGKCYVYVATYVDGIWGILYLVCIVHTCYTYCVYMCIRMYVCVCVN